MLVAGELKTIHAFMADVNGDNMTDIVGFSNNGVIVALSNGSGFKQPRLRVNGFNFPNWLVEAHPRFLADVNGDDKADIVGIGNDGVFVALSKGKTFKPIKLGVNGFGFPNWRVETHPRFLADVNGNGKADVIGFGSLGVYVSKSRSR